MNNDLISRSALKKDLLNRSFFPVIVKNALENAPAVDPEDLRAKGRWKKSSCDKDSENDEERYHCTNCGQGMLCKDVSAEALTNTINYCPKCGARMVTDL